ncbi:hypothetical protein ACOMHN_007518 [Nucella lapillus]
MPERESYCRRFFRWRKTSKKELQNVDEQVLRSVHSIKEKKYIPVGGDNQLWSVTSNPHHPSIPILMVHGMGGGVGLWAMNLDPLSRHRPVHAFDLLGFGRSSRPSFSSDAIQAEETFVQAIEDYRKAMGLDRFILVGHSLGGYLSASYALQHPQHVAHLVLADPWGMTPHPPGGAAHLPLFHRAVISVVNLGNPLSVLRAAGPLGRKERQPSATTLPATSSLYPVLPRRPQSNEPVLSRVREGHYERKQGRQAEDPATVQQKARLAVLRKGGNPGDRTQLLGQHVLQFGKFQVFCAVCRPRLRRSITKQELALHCRRATRGTEETTLLLNSLIDLYTQPHATDTLDAARAWQTWEEQKRHVKCILDPEGVSLYQEERRACLKDVQVRTRLHIPGVFPPASEPLHPR